MLMSLSGLTDHWLLFPGQRCTSWLFHKEENRFSVHLSAVVVGVYLKTATHWLYINKKIYSTIWVPKRYDCVDGKTVRTLREMSFHHLRANTEKWHVLRVCFICGPKETWFRAELMSPLSEDSNRMPAATRNIGGCTAMGWCQVCVFVRLKI